MGRYFRDHIGAVVLFGLCCGIFAAAFALYHLPLKAVGYPAAVCALLLGAYALWRALRQRQKHAALRRLTALPVDLARRLERYDTQTDEDYRAIIALLGERERALRGAAAERYSDMIDYYTTWAHQIKTPIASMRLTLQGEDSPAARRMAEDLFSIEQYVGMVLCYLRLDSDSTDYLFRECSVDAVVKAALRNFANRFIGKGLRLDYRETGLRVVTDSKWLSFVVEQVLSNALKYTPSGTIFIYAEGDSLCIRDTGIGIEPDDLPRIFEKGYTGLAGRTDQRASGLGLWLCRRICTNLGHGITAASTPGAGTLVKIDLSQRRANPE